MDTAFVHLQVVHRFYWAECNKWLFKFVPVLTNAWSSLSFKFKTTPNPLDYLFSLGHSAHSPLLPSACHCYLSFYFLLDEKPMDQINSTSPTSPQQTPQMKLLFFLSPTHLTFLLNKVLNNGALLRTHLNFLSKVAANFILTKKQHFLPTLHFSPTTNFLAMSEVILWPRVGPTKTLYHIFKNFYFLIAILLYISFKLGNHILYKMSPWYFKNLIPYIIITIYNQSHKIPSTSFKYPWEGKSFSELSQPLLQGLQKLPEQCILGRASL